MPTPQRTVLSDESIQLLHDKFSEKQQILLTRMYDVTKSDESVSKLLSKHHELLDDHIKKVQNIKYKEKKELIKIGIYTDKRDIKNIKKKMKDLKNQNIKKCEPSQVRNPNTLRCVKRDGKLGKKLVHSQDLD